MGKPSITGFQISFNISNSPKKKSTVKVFEVYHNPPSIHSNLHELHDKKTVLFTIPNNDLQNQKSYHILFGNIPIADTVIISLCDIKTIDNNTLDQDLINKLVKAAIRHLIKTPKLTKIILKGCLNIHTELINMINKILNEENIDEEY